MDDPGIPPRRMRCRRRVAGALDGPPLPARERLVALLMDAFDDACLLETPQHWAAVELLALAEDVVARWPPDLAPMARRSATERVATARRHLLT